MLIASLVYKCFAAVLVCLGFASLFPVFRATTMSLAHNATCNAIGFRGNRSSSKDTARVGGSHCSFRGSKGGGGSRRSPRLARANTDNSNWESTDHASASSSPRSVKSLSPRSTVVRGVVAGAAGHQKSNGPTHLYVLVHGLGGIPDDLSFLERCILRNAGQSALVLKPGCNVAAKSFDGVPNGAKRVATEIALVVAAHETTLTHISLVGNSLGGLYARYCASVLYDPSTNTVAGLIPRHFLTTATPHLGVGPFGYLGFFPSAIRRLGGSLMGTTMKQLLLLDTDNTSPLLQQMADPSKGFVEALGAFRTRCAYANATNDFLVAYETASLDPDAGETLRNRKSSGKFYKPNNNGWGDTSVDGKSSIGGWAGSVGGFAGAARIVDERRVPAESSERFQKALKASSSTGDSQRVQRVIAAGLRTLEWHHVDVEFPGVAPLAHNKICALQRDPVMRWLFSEGEFVVEHQAEFLTRSEQRQ
jgi:hypothetical protein